MSEPRYQAAADALDAWREDVLHGTRPTLYRAGSGALARIEIGPGLVSLYGGAPGQGKTAFTTQLTFDALVLNPDLRALICSVEMSPGVILNRQLARVADIDLEDVRHRRIRPEDSERLDRGLAILESLSERLAFVRPPYDLENIAKSADAVDAGLIVLDYIQRIAPPGDHGDRRGSVDATMSYLRQFADAGAALIVVAAVSRSKDSKGRSSYSEGLNLASFRESSELEFGADDAFILAPGGEEDEAPSSRVILKHLKSRHGEARDMPLIFDRAHQRFTPAEAAPLRASRPDRGKLHNALRSLWDSTGAAPDNDGANG